MLAALLDQPGIEVELDWVLPRRPNVIARVRGRGEGPGAAAQRPPRRLVPPALVARPARAVDRGRPAVRRGDHRHARLHRLHGRRHGGRGESSGPPPGDLVFLASMHHDTIGLGVKYALAASTTSRATASAASPRSWPSTPPTAARSSSASTCRAGSRTSRGWRRASTPWLRPIDLCVALRWLELTHEPDARLPDLPFLHVGQVHGGLAGGGGRRRRGGDGRHPHACRR